VADDEAISFLDCFAFATLGLAMTRLVEVLLELNCYSSSEVEKFSTRRLQRLARTILEQVSARTVFFEPLGFARDKLCREVLDSALWASLERYWSTCPLEQYCCWTRA